MKMSRRDDMFEEEQPMRMTVTLTGIFDEPRKNTDGSWEFSIAGRLPTVAEHQMLTDLFPDLETAVGRLLQKQAVLNCVK